MSTPDLTLEEAAAIFVLAVGELQAIKTLELEGETPDSHEIEVLYGVANKFNPDPVNNPVPPWLQMPPLEEDEEEPPTREIPL